MNDIGLQHFLHHEDQHKSLSSGPNPNPNPNPYPKTNPNFHPNPNPWALTSEKANAKSLRPHNGVSEGLYVLEK